jgi:hypothetical protein
MKTVESYDALIDETTAYVQNNSCVDSQTATTVFQLFCTFSTWWLPCSGTSPRLLDSCRVELVV